MWAVFRGLPEQGTELVVPYITLPGKHYSLSRARAVRVSEVHFETEVSRELHLPADYVLEAVRAYPYEFDGREDLLMNFEVGREIRFRIAEERLTSSPKVTGCKFN